MGPGKYLARCPQPKPGYEAAAADERQGQLSAELLREVSGVGNADEQEACAAVPAHAQAAHYEPSNCAAGDADANADAEPDSDGDAAAPDRSRDE